jgi:septal ring factor EnvC (AmiA/AmiB activator)
MCAKARVTDTKALADFRPALIQFREDVERALTSPGSDAMRILSWLQGDRLSHWKREIRIRSEAAMVAKSHLTQQLSSSQPRPSVDARKEYERCKRRVREAEEKYDSTRRMINKLRKEIDTYKGAIQPMASVARADMKTAIGRLDGHIRTLDEYTQLQQKEKPSGINQDADTLSQEEDTP